MKKLIVVEGKCNACGICTIESDLLVETSEGKAEVILPGIIPENSIEQITNMINMCPTQALKITEVAEGKSRNEILQNLKLQIEEKLQLSMPPQESYAFIKDEYTLSVLSSPAEYQYKYKSYESAESAGLYEFRDSIYSQLVPIAQQIVISYKHNKLLKVIKYEECSGNYKYELNKKLENKLLAYVKEIEACTNQKLFLDEGFLKFESKDSHILKDKLQYGVDNGWANTIANDVHSYEWFDSWINTEDTTVYVEKKSWFSSNIDYEEKDMYCFKLADASKKLNDQILYACQKCIPELASGYIEGELNNYHTSLEEEWNQKIKALIQKLNSMLTMEYSENKRVQLNSKDKVAGLDEANILYETGNSYRDGYGIDPDYQKAMECYQKAASLGSAAAMFEISKLYLYGRHGIEENHQKALEWLKKAMEGYQQAADLGSVEAMLKVGNLYFFSWLGVERNYQKALEWYKKAANLGNSEAMFKIGELYNNSSKFEEALGWYKKAANLGNSEAMFKIGELYNNSSKFEEALGWYKKAANLGNSEAMFKIGELCNSSTKFEEALGWYKKAANLGNAKAMVSLGTLYRKGMGVPQNYQQALEWYQKAANLGNDEAMTRLGTLYCKGMGAPQNYQQALEWYQKAANLGNGWAMTGIGNCYYDGLGVPQNYQQALEWFQKADRRGNSVAMLRIAELYYYGKGVYQNHQISLEWYQKAAEFGNKEAKDILDNSEIDCN